MKKSKQLLSAILAAAFVIGSMPCQVSAASSEIDRKLHDNDFTLYTVNCGTPDASVVPTGYRIGVCQSNVDQRYGKDATTGLNWGYVENENSKLATKGDANATDIQSSLCDMVFDDTTKYDADKSAVEYDFDLPKDMTAKTIKVTLGVKVPAWWGDNKKNFTRNEDIYVNDTKVGSNIPYTQNTLVEKTYDITLTSETQLKVKMKATNRTINGQQDPLLGYILIKTPEQYTVLDCQNKKASYAAAMKGKEYSIASKSDYDKAAAAVDALTDASSAENINLAYQNLVKAYGNLKEAKGPYTSFMGTDCDGAGRQMQDTNGNDIQAHGGQIFNLNGTYYWYGEDKSSGLAPTGVHMYSSKDLYNWTDGGVALKTLNSMDDFNQEPYKTLYSGYTDSQKKEVFRALDKNTAVVERPKVIYNAKSKQYVMWFHADGPLNDGDGPHSYGKAMAGVAVSDKPDGPFKFLSESRLHTSNNYTGDAGHKGMSRDMNLYLDDKDSNGDGVPDAYILYTSIGLDGSDNGAIYISRLNADYTALDKPQGDAVEGKDFTIAYNAKREGEAIFKYQSKYYLVTSACNGWAPTNSKYAVSDSPLGPWTDVGSPFVDDGSATSYETQSTCFITVDANKGKFIYLGDRWNYKDVSHIGDSRYVFLPVDFGANNSMILHDVKNWSLDRLGQNPGFTIPSVNTIPKATFDLTKYMNALPKTLSVKMATEPQAKNVQVTWSNDANAKSNPYAISTNIIGKLVGIDEPVEFTAAITNPKAVYFFDCGRDIQGTSSDYFDKMKNCPAIKNKTADQKYSKESLWGRTSVTNEEDAKQYDVGYAPSAGPDVWSTGLWATGGKTIDYAVTLDAGNYTACAGFQEWWNANRNLKFAVFDESGKELSSTPVAITGKTTNDIHAVSFTLDKATKVKLSISKTDNGSDAVLSWYEILQNDLPVVPVDDPTSTAPTTPSSGNPSNEDKTKVVVNDSKDRASVTTKPSSVTENDNKAEVKVDIPAVDKQLDSSKNSTIDVKLPTDAMVEEAGKKKTVETVVSIPSSVTGSSRLTVNVTVDKVVFASAKKNNSDIKIIVKDADTQQILVSWNFDGKELAASGTAAVDVNLTVKLQKSFEVKNVEKQAPKENGVVITFSHNGILPSAAKVTIPVQNESYKPGQVLYLYYQEPASDKLIYQNQTCTVENGGTVEVQITHCSNYVLLPHKLAETFKSDTNSDFAVDCAYTFKITSFNDKLPNFVIGTSGVFKTELVNHKGSDYFYKITAIGMSGQKAGIYVNGERLLVATVKNSATSVICDTTRAFMVKQNGSYTFKLTAKKQPTFICGSGNVFKVFFVKKTGNQYFYKVMAVGKPGQKAGFYINRDKKPVVTVTISK